MSSLSKNSGLQQLQILEKIGQGGMSTVWKVSHPRHTKPFALKVLNSSQEHLDQELMTLALLDHPNVIRILDFGQIKAEDAEKYSFSENSSWLLFEYVKGESILRYAENKNWISIRKIMLQLLQALSHIHARGIIHRDICPGNVLWCQRERCPKIIDFGIALQKNQTEDPFSGYGSYGYAAPEVMKGENIGPWSDLYSVGYLFFGMLSHLEALPKGLSKWLGKLTHPVISHRFLCGADALHALSQFPLSYSDTEKNEIQTPASSPSPPLSFTLTAPIHLTEVPETTFRDLSPQEQKQHTAPFQENWNGSPYSGVALDWAIPSISLLPLRLPRLIGREKEQDWLWQYLQKTIEKNRSHILQIFGEKGIGVTRLMRWFQHRAHETGAADVHYLSKPEFDLQELLAASQIRAQIVFFDGEISDEFPEISELSAPILFVLGRALYQKPEQITATRILQPLEKKYWLALLDSFATISPITASWLCQKGEGYPEKLRSLLTKLLSEQYLVQGQHNLIWTEEPEPPQFTPKGIQQELDRMDKGVSQGIEAINLYPLHCMWKYLQSYPPQENADLQAFVWRKLSNSAIDVEDRPLLKELLNSTDFLPYTSPKEQFRVKRRIIHLNMALNNYEQTNKLSLELLNSLTDHNSREYLLAHWQYSLDLFLQGKFHTAHERYLFTKKQASRLKAKDLEIYSLIGMGISRGYSGEFHSSIQLLTEAENILISQGQSFTTGTLYEMYTVNYIGLQDIQQAKTSIHKCFQIHKLQGKNKPINALMLWLAIEHMLNHSEQVIEILEELQQRITNVEPSIHAHICLYHYWYSSEEIEQITYWNKHLRLLEYHPSIDSLLGVLYRDILQTLPKESSIEESVKQTYLQFWNKLGWDVAEKWGCFLPD